MKILTADDIAATSLKVLGYSNPGCGKTRLFSCLPWGTERFGDKAIYVPFDVKERGLMGVLPHNREHLVVVERDSDDPYSFMMDVLDADWEKTHGAKTIILDTMTNWSNDLMTAAVNSSAYGVKTIQMGRQTMRLADKPHYGMVHNMVGAAVRKIKAHPLNVFALFWADWQQPESGDPGGLYGGPCTVNINRSREICGEFDNVWYLRTAPAAKGIEYWAHTAPYGFWTAKLHGGGMINPMPERRLEGDPRGVWEEFVKVQSL